MATSARTRSPKATGTILFVTALAVALVAMPGHGAIAVPTFGAKAILSTTDFRPTLTQIDTLLTSDPTTVGVDDTGAFLKRWDRGTTGSVADDCFYIKFGTAAATTLAAGDYRIGGGDATNCAPGVILTSSSTEVTTAPAVTDLGDFRSFVRWAEFDGKPGFSDGDMLYVDLTTAVSGCVGAAGTLGGCDIRLTSRAGAPVATFGLAVGGVSASDADLTEANTVNGVLPDSTALTAFTDVRSIQLFYHDATQNRLLDSGDSLYLRITDGAPATQEGPTNFAANVPLAMDVRLTAYGSLAAGTMVAAGNVDHVPTFTTTPVACILRVPGASVDLDRLVLSWRASCTNVAANIQLGDMALNTVSGQTAGTLVTSSATGAGTGGTLSASTFISQVYYADSNANNRYDDADPVYLHKPLDIGGTTATIGVTTNDIRLKTYSSFAAGSVVGNADADKTSFNGAGVATSFTLRFFDADRSQGLQALRPLLNAKVTGPDTGFASGEAAYVESTAAVATGSIRVSPIAFASGSVVAAGNPDVNTVGGALTPLANVMIKDTGATANVYDAGECAYISTDGLVTAGDIRITLCGAFAAGSTVAATDADCVACSTTPTSVIVVTTNSDYITGPDTTFTAGTDMVYQDDDGTANTAVGAGLIRITPLSYASGSTVACTAPANIDCGTALLSLANAKVTGTDGAWTTGSEMVYVSPGATNRLIATDVRVSPICSGCTATSATPFTLGTFTVTSTPSTVAAGDPDLPGSNYGPGTATGTVTGDALYLSVSGIGGAAESKVPIHNDIRLGHPSLAYGTLVTTGNADYSIRLTTIATAATRTLVRWDRGNVGVPTDDTFFVRPTTATTLTPVAGDVRLLPSIVQPAGTMVTSGDTDSTATVTLDSVAFVSRVCFVNPSGSTFSGYDLNDFLYVDTSGLTAGTALALGNALRITPTIGLSTNYAAGTIVVNSDVDRTSFTSCTASPGGGRAFYQKFMDLDNSGAYTAGGTDNQKLDHLYVSADRTTCGTSTDTETSINKFCSVIPLLGDVPLTGTAPVGTSTGGGGGGGGGGGSTATTTTTSGTTTTSTSTDTTTSTSTDTTTSTSTSTGATLASINQALADSLMVTRSDGVNTLMWDLQPGVAGYQIFSSDSPFVLLGEVPGDQTTFTDSSGGKNTLYVVTAFFDDLTKLTADMFNNGEVPGYSGVPTGEKAPAGKKGFIPAPGLAFALLALGAAFVLVRRKL